MFHLSPSRKVRRTDLGRDHEPTSRSSSQSPILGGHEAQLKHPFDYDFIDRSQPAEATSSRSWQVSHSEDGEQTFSFRLFASPSKDKEAIATDATESGHGQRITLQAIPSPSSLPLSEGRFLRPNRLESYYFTSSLSDGELRELRKQYAAIAVSSEEILSISRQRQWPGTALPWRVIHISSPAATSKNRTTTPSRPVLEEASKRSKPNKKRRIHLRKIFAARTASANAILRARETAEEKEKAIREKKSAKNRKNQLRRREKERRKKADVKVSTCDGEQVDTGHDADTGDG